MERRLGKHRDDGEGSQGRVEHGGRDVVVLAFSPHGDVNTEEYSMPLTVSRNPNNVLKFIEINKLLKCKHNKCSTDQSW